MKRNYILAAAVLVMILHAGAAEGQDSAAVYTLAVSDFKVLNESKGFEWIGESCSEAITAKLLQEKNIRIVERKYLATIIEELKFQESGLVDERHAVELGKLLGAKYFILGSVSLLHDIVTLRASAVNVETAEIYFSEDVKGTLEKLSGLQAALARKIAVKFLGKSMIRDNADPGVFLSVSRSFQSKLNKLKKLSQPLPLFAIDPARKRKASEFVTADLLCDEIIENYPDAVIGYYYKAMFAMYAGDYNESEAAYRSGIQIDPGDQDLLFFRSMFLFQTGKYQEAKTLLNYLTVKYPHDARLQYGLAKVLIKINDTSHAIEALIDALRGFPFLPEAESFLQTLITQRQWRMADFSNAAYWNSVTLFVKVWGQGDEIRASDREIVSSVQNSFPDLFISYFAAGKIYSSMGNSAAALLKYQQCLERVPSYPPVHRELAYVYLRTGNCSLGKQHATLYLQTSQSIDDYKELHEEIQRCQ